MPKNIYIVGAQCTGKTTLIGALSAHFNAVSTSTTMCAPLVLTEVARNVMRQHDFTASDITSSPNKALLLQKLILEAQHSTEQTAGSQWFISDRSGFDPIVYTKRYVGEEEARSLMRTEIWSELKKRMGQSLVVVCEAGAEWLVDDGVRLMPEDKADWTAFHDLFCASLEEEGLQFVVLHCEMKDLKDRVNFVLDRWGGSS